jgi:hypothetical protein
MRTRSTYSLFKDERGVAMSESIILAIFLTFMLAIVMHIHRVYDAKLETYASVRSCAWAYANGACKSLPAHCAGVTVQDGLSPAGLDSWAQENANGFMEAIAEASGFAHEMMDKLQIVGRQASLSTQSETIDRSPLIGGGSGQAKATYAVFCNEERREQTTMVEQAFCRVVGSGFPGC